MIYISTFLKNILKKENREILFIILLGILMFFIFKTCNSLNNKNNELRQQKLINIQNIKALTDSIKIQKNKAGEIEYIKNSFIAELKDLKQLNIDLYNESKKEIGNLKSIIKAQANISFTNITISNELYKYPDSLTYGLKFKEQKADSGLIWNIEGESKFKMQNNIIYPSETTIFKNNLKIKLILGFTETDNEYKVFARSPSSNISFSDLSGALIIPKKPDITCPTQRNKKWGIGIHLGYGINYSNNQIKMSPNLSVGLNYNILHF